MSDLLENKSSETADVQATANPQPTESKTYNFKVPEKLIKNPMDLEKWEKSEAYYDILGFINSLSYIVQGKKNSFKCELSLPVQKILKMLQSMENLAKETPPIDQPARFGNAAYRSWFEKMKNVGNDLF